MGCSNGKSRKQNLLETQMNAFMISGEYHVQVKKLHQENKLSKPVEGEVTLTNSLGVIEFKGLNSFTELDSIKISLYDSTLVRQFSVNHFIDKTPVSADISGIAEDYVGYAFGENEIPTKFKNLFNKTNITGSQFLFIVGQTKNGHIIIRRIERVVLSGEKLMDINKVYILSHQDF